MAGIGPTYTQGQVDEVFRDVKELLVNKHQISIVNGKFYSIVKNERSKQAVENALQIIREQIEILVREDCYDSW